MFTPVVAVTAQHRSMLDQVNEVFGITPDFDLDIHQPGQTLTSITTRALAGVQRLLAEQRPDAVVVQGDTTTVFAAALAAFYEQIPVVHLEAGLRTDDPYSPYPEEINRRLATQLATLHLAPTATSKANLLAENVDPATVVVTGNTVIDALLWASYRASSDYGDPALAGLDDQRRAGAAGHRAPAGVVGRPAARGRPRAGPHRDARTASLRVVFPVHRNPLVRDAVLPALRDLPNVTVTEPLPYGGFARLMNRATVILTDSGGVQEEGPSLGKPVLVMRETTERPEAVRAGTVRLVGTDEDLIVRYGRAGCSPIPPPTRRWPTRSTPTGTASGAAVRRRARQPLRPGPGPGRVRSRADAAQGQLADGAGAGRRPARPGLVTAQVSLGDPLGHAHAPRVDHEFGQFRLVELGEPGTYPVVALVRAHRHEELVRLAGHQRGPLLLGKAEADQFLVRRDGQEDDPADPELDVVADQGLVGAGQGQGQPAHVLRGSHAGQAPGRKAWASLSVTASTPASIRCRALSSSYQATISRAPCSNGMTGR